jgi:hypothetical protein
MEKLPNPKESIYLIVYNQARTPTEISNILYKKRNSRVSDYIGKLLEDEWIRPIENQYLFKKGQKKDRRKDYYLATSKGFLDSFQDDIEFKDNEYEKLKNIFEKEDFKLFVSLMTEAYSETVTKNDASLIWYPTIRTFKEFIAITTNFIKILLAYGVSKTGKKPKKFKGEYFRALEAGISPNEVKNEFINRFKKIMSSETVRLNKLMKIWEEEKVKQAQKHFEKLTFDFIELGNDLLTKIACQWENSPFMLDMGTMSMAMVQLIEEVEHDKTLQHKIMHK